MSSKRMIVIALISIIMTPAIVHAAVNVNFVSPERFTDEDFRSSGKRDGILKDFENISTAWTTVI